MPKRRADLAARFVRMTAAMSMGGVAFSMAVAAVALSGVSPAVAATEVSNLAETNTVNFSAAPPPNFSHASSFTTGETSYTLSSVTLRLHCNSPPCGVQARLRSDSGGQPGAVLETLGTANLPSGESIQVFGSTGTLLTAATTYWVTAGEAGSGFGQWLGTFSTAQASSSGWTIGDQCFQSNDGATWAPVFPVGPPNESALFSVEATAGVGVPALSEPAAGVVGLLLCMAGVLATRRRLHFR